MMKSTTSEDPSRVSSGPVALLLHEFEALDKVRVGRQRSFPRHQRKFQPRQSGRKTVQGDNPEDEPDRGNGHCQYEDADPCIRVRLFDLHCH
jgi:hypothetical protein